MDAREYLTQILDLKRRMDKLKEKIRRYKEIASSPRSPSLEERYSPNPNTASPFERALMECDNLERELSEIQKVYNVISLEARYILCQVDDDKERLILQYRYVEGKSYGEIADLLNKSVKTIRRYEDSAFEHIRIPENHMEICP